MGFSGLEFGHNHYVYSLNSGNVHFYLFIQVSAIPQNRARWNLRNTLPFCGGDKCSSFFHVMACPPK